jgi:tRNA A37 threonylcarbamoyladenosine modification protein TsaB
LYFLAAPAPNTSSVEKPLVGISNAKDIPFHPKSQNLIDLYLSQKTTHDDELPLPTYLRNNVAQKSLK